MTFERRRRRPLGWVALGAGIVLVIGIAWAEAPQVTSVTPADGAQAVAGDSPITVSFDRAMDTGSVEARLSMQPAVPGRFALGRTAGGV